MDAEDAIRDLAERFLVTGNKNLLRAARKDIRQKLKESLRQPQNLCRYKFVSNDLDAAAETGTKQGFVCDLIRVIAAVSDQAHVVVRIAGPRDT